VLAGASGAEEPWILPIKKTWLDQITTGKKGWEFRSKRPASALAQSPGSFWLLFACDKCIAVVARARVRAAYTVAECGLTAAELATMGADNRKWALRLGSIWKVSPPIKLDKNPRGLNRATDEQRDHLIVNQTCKAAPIHTYGPK